ncbi:MAG: holo-ACP synthase [Candidatus Poribacteria bacterium]|nr:holo-ACP synthase [Candidatus Poribacteria bacterium]MDE0324447.1 holo-ACP synthase [Candidatus Poribacteria bacterium]
MHSTDKPMHQHKIQGIGIDIVEVERIRDASRRWGARFEQRVYTQQELTYCGEAPSRYWRLAARFAAKEAAFKALGTGLTTGMRWQDIEIRADAVGKPELILHGEVQRYAHERNINSIFVSLSHTNVYAVAQVTLCST